MAQFAVVVTIENLMNKTVHIFGRPALFFSVLALLSFRLAFAEQASVAVSSASRRMAEQVAAERRASGRPGVASLKDGGLRGLQFTGDFFDLDGFLGKQRA